MKNKKATKVYVAPILELKDRIDFSTADPQRNIRNYSIQPLADGSIYLSANDASGGDLWRVAVVSISEKGMILEER